MSARPLKRAFAGFLAVAYFVAMMVGKVSEIHAVYPDTYRDLINLLVPHPIVLVYAVSPLLVAISIYHLYRFTLTWPDPLTSSFTPESLQALRMCGLFLIAGGGVSMGFETLMCRIIGAESLPFNSGAGLPFLVIGYALATISRNGNVLAAKAKKLRSELDEIV